MVDRTHLPTTLTEAESETLDLHDQWRTFTAGEIVGERYQILALLGRGGMGEVWHAFDLKLRVDVALKALRSDIFKTERRRESLRQEVRAAREVVSPNVCRVFDLHEMEGLELVSMEFVDGQTLLDAMRDGAPFDLQEAQDIASQFLAGLDAIHQIGLVHRDIKPENIMLTRSGRVVVMDFGIAREEAEGSGTVSGTAAYMAPEQAAGQAVDARADIYSAGVVLAEVVNPDGLKNRESRESVWEAVRAEPARIPDTPWSAVITKAVATDRDHRFDSAADLTRALEEVTLRVAGADNLHPYPGLAAFTEDDAEYFFGREAEVEQMWRKLEGPARMLGIMGPSGAGKSSFIAAGLISHAPNTWEILPATPGNAVLASFASVVAREMAGDPDAVELLLRIDEPDVAVELISRWAGRSPRSLIVVDQFEELFTQNSSEDQRRFADLLRRFVIEADVHVLLSMRDDFAAACNIHESLRPIFQDLTVLDPPTGPNLRRAIVWPAQKCGYRFEDDALVEEVLAEVEEERGALPLMAFAAARAWEKRDRETGLLTREAYQAIGGVGGALAQHAEATVDRIGTQHIAVVRELFRNLVTAEGTRAVREWNELLSVFVDSQDESPEEVLRALIDARLLTSYEVREDEHEPTRRVEIIHESLLANWPRLVRWQTQDQEGAQIRDELRQSARSWDEHGRHDDRLWTGTAFREFELWRERYPGGLTETEESFARATTSFSARRRRRRRILGAAGVAILLAVLAIVTGFWRKSERQTRIAEAQRLLALGQLEMERFPTAALAWAKASLNIADTKEGRLFALEAISRGPLARIRQFDVNNEGVAHHGVFSPNGEWIAYMGYDLLKVDHRSGGAIRVIDSFPNDPNAAFRDFYPVFDRESLRLSVWRYQSESRSAVVRTFGVPDFEKVVQIERPLGKGFFEYWPTSAGVYHLNRNQGGVEVWHLPHGGEWRLFDTVDGFDRWFFDHLGEWAVFRRGQEFFLQSLVSSGVEPRVIARFATEDWRIRVDPNCKWIATAQPQQEQVSVWPAGLDVSEPVRRIDTDGLPISSALNFQIDQQGRRIAVAGNVEGVRMAKIWDLSQPDGAEPLVLRNPDAEYMNGVSFEPSGRWAVTGNTVWASFWPIPENPPLVFSGASSRLLNLAFTVDGASVFVPLFDGGPHLLHLTRGSDNIERLDLPVVSLGGIAMDPAGQFVLAAKNPTGVLLLPFDGSEHRVLEGFDDVWATALAYDADRALVAAAPYRGSKDQKIIRVVNLDGGSLTTLGPAEDAGDGFIGGFSELEFLPDGRLLSGGKGGIRRWNLENGECELLYPGMIFRMDVSPDGRFAVAALFEDMGGFGPALRVDLATGQTRIMPEYGHQNRSCAIGPDSDVVAMSDNDGRIRIGRLSGGEPHTLFGHSNSPEGLSFSPDGRLLASGDVGGAVRIWSVPDVTGPPPQEMSLGEFRAKLESFTNLRVVPNETSSTGWLLEVGPFQGWANVPEW